MRMIQHVGKKILSIEINQFLCVTFSSANKLLQASQR